MICGEGGQGQKPLPPAPHPIPQPLNLVAQASRLCQD